MKLKIKVDDTHRRQMGAEMRLPPYYILISEDGQPIENVRFVEWYTEKIINGKRHVYFLVIAEEDDLYFEDEE